MEKGIQGLYNLPPLLFSLFYCKPIDTTTQPTMQLPFLKDKQRVVPNTRSQRTKCWESRDNFFTCLDSIKVINSLQPENQDKINANCSKELNQFNQDCINSWIKYFQKKRVTDWEKSNYVMAVPKDTIPSK